MKTIDEMQLDQQMLDLQVKRVNLFRDQGDTRNDLARWRTWHLYFMAALICLSILTAGNQISVTLDEVCPTYEEGSDFLLTRAT